MFTKLNQLCLQKTAIIFISVIFFSVAACQTATDQPSFVSTATLAPTFTAAATSSLLPTNTPSGDYLTYYNMGIGHLNDGQYELAIEQFNQALELAPYEANIYANRGLAHHWLEAYNEAGDDYGRAIELDPTNYLAYYNRGVSHTDRGQYEHALADYRRAVEHNSQDPLPHNNLAWTLVYYLDTNYTEALEHALISVGLDSNDYNNDTLALVYYKQGRYQDALERYNIVLSINPILPESLKGRGDTHLALGNQTAALEDYEAYLSLVPDGPGRAEVEEIIKNLNGQ